MALERVDKMFSLEAYKQWLKKTYGTGPVPDWARSCNGRPIFIENDRDILVLGLDDRFYICQPEWLANFDYDPPRLHCTACGSIDTNDERCRWCRMPVVDLSLQIKSQAFIEKKFS